MDATELAYAGAAQQARLIAAGEVSAREVVGAVLRRIERLDPQLNAFRVLLAERALAEADPAEAPRPPRQGAPRPPPAAAPAGSARCSASRARSRTTPTSRASRPRAAPPRRT